MSNLSENYYLRECYFRREQAPSISMMKKKMSPPLAAIYFKSMKPKVKVLAGLEPSLKGGGTDWYQPPEELLQSRAVLKPIKKQVLKKLNYLGVDAIGNAIFQRHRKEMDLQIEQGILDSDINWRSTVLATAHRVWNDLVAAAKKKNTEQIKNDFDEFVYFYRQSLGKIEILFHESAIAEIKNARENSLHEMQIKYTTVLKHQATLIYDEYDKKLLKEKTRLKDEFIRNIEINRTAIHEKVHDLKVEKHMALDKIKQSLHCQNLACQIYVAIKEREDCLKETDELKYQHKKKVEMMKTTILMQDLQIHTEGDKEKKRHAHCNIWRMKVCRVVKVFQKFVLHCLICFPEHAEFFINMEKLMLLQVNEVLEEPTAPSIIELEKEEFHTPIPQPKPFYLFCDKGYKPKVERDLCPRHSGISATRTSEIPVMIINKQCLYAACDNFEQFTNKIKDFIHGHRGDDADFKDDLVYEHLVPVKYTSSQQLSEVKLESSLLQVLHQEIAHMQSVENEIDAPKCNLCGLPWCSCHPSHQIKLTSSTTSSTTSSKAPQLITLGIDKNLELVHEREPNWESFCRHFEPKKCSCCKTVKKHLTEHLPMYMRHMTYAPSDLPDYEMCPLSTLKYLVKEARNEAAPISPVELIARTKDMGTQYDLEFDTFADFCKCFSEPKVHSDAKLQGTSSTDAGNDGGISSSLSYSDTRTISQSTSSFAMSRALSLRNLLKDSSDIKELFTRKDC